MQFFFLTEQLVNDEIKVNPPVTLGGVKMFFFLSTLNQEEHIVTIFTLVKIQSKYSKKESSPSQLLP